MVGNLVDNAIDAAAAPGGAEARPSPTVDVRLAADRAAGLVELSVTDSGPGIDPDLLDHIFDRGFSTKPADASGRGFGLAVVRDILARHRGTVELAHSTAAGTRFVARWPMDEGDRR